MCINTIFQHISTTWRLKYFSPLQTCVIQGNTQGRFFKIFFWKPFHFRTFAFSSVFILLLWWQEGRVGASRQLDSSTCQAAQAQVQLVPSNKRKTGSLTKEGRIYSSATIWRCGDVLTPPPPLITLCTYSDNALMNRVSADRVGKGGGPDVTSQSHTSLESLWWNKYDISFTPLVRLCFYRLR